MRSQVTVQETIEPMTMEWRSRGLADGTVRLYVGYLRRFAQSCDEVGHRVCPVSSVDARHVARGRLNYKTNSTRNQYVTAVRAWLNWCVRMQYMTQARAGAAMGDVRRKKHVRKPKVYIPAEQFSECLEIAGARHPRYRATIAVALYTLARRSEIEGVQLKHIHLRERTLEMYRQKRGRWTDVQMTPDLYEEIETWLSWYAQDQGCTSILTMLAEHPDWYLLPLLTWVGAASPETRVLGHGRYYMHPEKPSHTTGRVVKHVLDGLNVSSTEHGRSVRHLGEGGHTIRRSGARAMLDYLTDNLGADRALLQVSMMLDHEDTQVTLVYIGVDLERERLNDFLRTNSMYAVNPSRRATAGGTVTSIARSRTQPNTLRELPQNEEAGSN